MRSTALTIDQPAASATRRRRTGRGRRGVALATALVALAGATTTGDAASAGVTPEPRPGGIALEEPAIPSVPGTRTLSLLTGQQVTVSSDPSGHVAVTPSGAGGAPATGPLPVDGRPANPPDLQVTAIEESGKPMVLSAVPPEAAGLVASGAVDGDLFDLNALVARGFGVSSTPVTVHFDGVTTAAESEQKADALPGSTYMPGTATAGQATVSVPVSSSSTFWDAVTTPRGFDPATPEGQAWALNPQGGPRDLADGLAGLTLGGAQLPTVSAPASTTPTYQLTVRVHASKDPARWTYRVGDPVGVHRGLVFSSAPLIGVTGPAAGALTKPTVSCVGDKPVCGTVVMTYTVPAGVYYLAGRFRDTRDTMLTSTYFEEPEVAVFGNRTIDLAVDDGIWIDPRTPKRSDLAGFGLSMKRTLPDGRIIYNAATSNGEYYTGYYLVPTKQPARTGGFNVQVTHEWHEPYVTMITDRGRDLKAGYVVQRPAMPGDKGYRPELSLRDTRLAVVDAGTGTPADFARIDAKGKLVVLGPSPDQQIACGVELKVMERAAAAGAVAVVFDPRTDRLPTGTCMVTQVPILEGNVYAPVPDLPLVTLQPDEAQHLRARIAAERRVTVHVDSPGHAAMGYLYELSRHFSGGIPSSIDQTVTSTQLATRITSLRDSAGSAPYLGTHAFVPGVNLSFNWTVQLFPTTTPGRTLTEYLSASREVKWDRGWTRTEGVSERADEIVTKNDTRAEAWFARPQSYGPNDVPSEPNQWTGWALCSFCRQGDELTPYTAIGHSEPTHSSRVGTLPAMVLTDAHGQQIPQTTTRSGVPGFQLSPGEQRYTLVSTSGDDRFEWQLTSGHVIGEHKPPGTYCFNELFGLGECGAAQPLIYLRYVAPVDDANTAAAATRHAVTITPYHQADDAPAIRQVATQVSFDGAATWTPAKMKPLRDGSWTATFTVPSLADTDGHVTLRTTAADEAGNTTNQLRTQAYPLR